MRAPKSVCHLHLLSAINTELRRRPAAGSENATLRILDVGCGRGDLMVYLSQELPGRVPHAEVEVYGYDIVEHAGRSGDYLPGVLAAMAEAEPAIPWERRIRLVSANDPIPFDDASFDLVVSNQVLEHVMDHERLFEETRRVLKESGTGIHVFPPRDVLVDPHLKLPLVHRIADRERRKRCISWLSRLGLGRHKENREEPLEEYSARQADYIQRFTNYLGSREILAVATKAGFRASYRYTKELFLNKLASVVARAPRDRYAIAPSRFLDRLAFPFCKRFASVTLLLEKSGRVGGN